MLLTGMEETADRATPELPVFDGMALPRDSSLLKDAKKRFEDIKNLECRKDDVILGAYPKSGKTNYSAIFAEKF